MSHITTATCGKPNIIATMYAIGHINNRYVHEIDHIKDSTRYVPHISSYNMRSATHSY